MPVILRMRAIRSLEDMDMREDWAGYLVRNHCTLMIFENLPNRLTPHRLINQSNPLRRL